MRWSSILPCMTCWRRAARRSATGRSATTAGSSFGIPDRLGDRRGAVRRNGRLRRANQDLDRHDLDLRRVYRYGGPGAGLVAPGDLSVPDGVGHRRGVGGRRLAGGGSLARREARQGGWDLAVCLGGWVLSRSPVQPAFARIRLAGAFSGGRRTGPGGPARAAVGPGTGGLGQGAGAGTVVGGPLSDQERRAVPRRATPSAAGPIGSGG